MDTKIIKDILGLDLDLTDEKTIDPMLKELMTENLFLKNLLKEQQDTIKKLYDEIKTYQHRGRKPIDKIT